MKDESAVGEGQTDDIDDIGGDVAAALNEIRGGDAPAETQITLDKSEQRPRDEAGKFAKALKDDAAAAERKTLTLPVKEKPAEGVIPDPTAQIGIAAPPGAPQVLQTPATTSITPPGALKSELKAKFGELPPEWQQEIARCENEAQKALRNQDEDRLFGRRINQLSSPYLPTIRAEGATVEKAFENYLQTAHVLRQGSPTQKTQALHTIAQQFNVDLNLPLPGAGSDPRYSHLENELSELRNRLQAQDQQRQQQENLGLHSQIDTFASEPGHEHFETVRAHMGTLIEGGIAKDLPEAYQMAIWAHPDLRSTLVAAEQKAAEDKRRAEQAALTGRAKNAAVSVTGAPGSSRPLNGAQSHGSIEDDVRAAMSEVQGRV